jgi:hypothetical protein
MKSKLFVFVAFVLATTIMSSCTKYYTCECVNYQGTKTTHSISAKTEVAANKKCDEMGNLGDCALQ